MNPTRDWLDIWHKLLDDPAIPPFDAPDEMAGVLADLRHDPDRLLQAFAPLPRGDELLARVKICIGAQENQRGVYLIPKAKEATDSELRDLVLDAIARGCQCCRLSVPEYEINIHRRPITNAECCQSAALVEQLGDLYIKLSCDSNSLESEAMSFLRDPLYSLAASPEVQGYCLTPLCPEEIRRVDPYEPQVALWMRGARAVIRWSDDQAGIWVDIFVS